MKPKLLFLLFSMGLALARGVFLPVTIAPVGLAYNLPAAATGGALSR